MYHYFHHHFFPPFLPSFFPVSSSGSGGGGGITKLNFPTSMGSFFDKFNFTETGLFLASPNSSSVMFMSPKIHFNEGILNLKFFSALLQATYTFFSQTYSSPPEPNSSPTVSSLKGVSKKPFPVIVISGSSSSLAY